MILHHFCWRSSQSTLFWSKTLIFDQKSWKYFEKLQKYHKIQGFLRKTRDPWSPNEPCARSFCDRVQAWSAGFCGHRWYAGVHTMRSLNTFKESWIEATTENLNFVKEAIHSWNNWDRCLSVRVLHWKSMQMGKLCHDRQAIAQRRVRWCKSCFISIWSKHN